MVKTLVLLALLLLKSHNTFGDSPETVATTSQENESSSSTTPHSHVKSGEELQSAHNQRLPLIFNGGVLEFTTEAVSSTSTPSSTSTITSTTVATTTAVEPELQARGTKSSKLDPTSPASQPENEKCADNAENCLPNIIYCKQGGYISLMQKHCSKTCGLCKKEITKIGTTPHHPVFQDPCIEKEA